MNQINRAAYGGQTRPAPTPSHSLGQTLGAAGRQANDMYNLWQLLDRDKIDADPDFDVLEAGRNSDLWNRYGDELANAQSLPEFQQMEARLRQRDEDLSLLGDQGFGGFAATMGMGLLSPTVFIPFVGGARGVKGVAQSFALAGVAATVQEAPLIANQLGRTDMENFIGIAAGTVLGGLMGSAAVMLRRPDLDRMARDLNPDVEPAVTGRIMRQPDGRMVREGGTTSLVFPPEIGAGPRQLAREPSFRAELAGRAEGERVVRQAETSLEGRPLSASRGVPAFDGVATRQLDEFVQAERAQLAKVETDLIRVQRELEEVEARPTASFEETNALRTQRAELEQAKADGEEVLKRAAQETAYRQRTGDTGEAPRSAQAEEPDLPVVGREATPGGGAAGAQVTNTRMDPTTGQAVRDAGSIAPALGAGEVLAHTSPIARMIQQRGWAIKSSVLRNLAQRLSDSGLVMAGNRQGIITAPGGTVEHNLGPYRGFLGVALQVQHEAYLKYLKSGGPIGLGDRLLATVNNAANRAPQGKITYLQFKEQVMDASNDPTAPVIPEALAVAQTWQRSGIFHEINEEMLGATAARGDKPLYDIRENYFMQSLSPDLVAQNRSQFVADYADEIMNGVTADFARRVAKLHKQVEGDEAMEQLLLLTRQEAADVMQQLRDQLSRITDPAELDPRVDQIRALRDEARELFTTKLESRLEGKPESLLQSPEYVKGMRAAVRQEIAEEVEALRETANALEADLPSNVFESMTEAKQLKQQMSAIRRSFGAVEEAQERVLRRVEQNEELSMRALDRVVNASKRFFRDSAQWDEKKLTTEYNRLVALSRKSGDVAERGMARVTKLEGGEQGEKLQLERLRQAGREDRSARASDRVQDEVGRQLGREEMLEDIRVRLDEAKKNVNRVNDKRAVRNAALLEKAEDLTPERVRKQIAEMKAKTAARADGLEEALTKARATDINVARGEFDFQDMAKEVAEDLADKIVGNFTKLGVMDSLVGMRGPMKARIMKMDYEKKKRYMEKDTEKALARYTQQMSADIELYRAYGDVNASGALQAIKEDMRAIREALNTRTVDQSGKKITAARREKELRAHEKNQSDAYNAFNESLDRIRGLRGLPSSPAHYGYRLGRLFQHWNVTTLMGSAAVTSIPDAGRTVMAYGLTHTLRTSWVPLVRGLASAEQKAFNKESIRQLKLLGVGMDTFTQHRSKGYMDLTANSPFQSRPERAMESLSMATPAVALFGQWTDAAKLVSGMATMARVTGAIEGLARGRAKPADVQFLASLNIDEGAARGIWHQLNTPNGSTRHEDILIPNLESWDDRNLRRIWAQAVTRESDRLVVTPGLERPLWMDENPLYKLVAQFRSFTMAANTKMTVAALQTRDMAMYHTMQGVVGSLALGTLSYYIWAHTVGDRAVKEMQNAGWETWADQALYRSGLLGALSEVQSIGTTIPLTRDFMNLEGQASAGRRPDSIIGAVAGPTFGKMQTMASVLAGIDSPTEGTLRQARKMIPYQNVFYLRQGFNWLEQGTADYFNLPERRQ